MQNLQTRISTPSDSRRTSQRGRLLLAAFVLSTLAVSPTLADAPTRPLVVSGVSFAPSATAEGQALELHNAALFRYRVVFKAYAAALYLAPGALGSEVLRDVSKRLELSYFWSIDAEDFGPVAMQILERMHSAETLERLRPRLERMHRSYRDIEPGDRYSLTYVPGRGTELALNGRALVTIPGADFARVYFSIWFGSEPLDERLRRNLVTTR